MWMNWLVSKSKFKFMITGTDLTPRWGRLLSGLWALDSARSPLRSRSPDFRSAPLRVPRRSHALIMAHFSPKNGVPADTNSVFVTVWHQKYLIFSYFGRISSWSTQLGQKSGDYVQAHLEWSILDCPSEFWCGLAQWQERIRESCNSSVITSDTFNTISY